MERAKRLDDNCLKDSSKEEGCIFFLRKIDKSNIRSCSNCYYNMFVDGISICSNKNKTKADRFDRNI